MQPNVRTTNGELPKGQPATATEPRVPNEAFHQLRSQSARESLGAVGQGGLLKPSLQAGALFAVVFAVLTFVPYVIEKNTSSAKATAPATPDESEAKQPATPVTPNPDPSPKTPIAPIPVPKISAKEDALGKMGEAGTKTGTPKTKDPFKAGPDDDLPGLK